MTVSSDLIVLGAGPAGGHAALAAAKQGMKVVLLDEQQEAGGQIWRAPLFQSDGSAEKREGDRLRQDLTNSSVITRFSRRVWSVTRGYRLDAIGPEGNEAFTAPSLIVATGAYERVIPFPGWTLPGMLGLAAATILLKSQALAPPKGWIAAGVGPLLAAVTAGFTKKGHPPQAIIDQSTPADWLRVLPALASRPAMLKQGLGWVLSIAGHRIPVYFGHRIIRAEGGQALRQITFAPLGGGREKTFLTSTLFVGHGLVPGGEVPKLLGAEHHYEALRGGWVPRCDETGRTSLPGLWAIGDGAGIRGGTLAIPSGTLAGLAASHEAGLISSGDFQHRSQSLLASMGSLSRFSDAMANMMALRPEQVAAIPSHTIICRCEDVTREDIETAIDAGAQDISQLKHFTRCGMGPCQGRMCGDVTAELLAQKTGKPRENIGYWTARPPLRPVALNQMLGTFSYSDIPIPKPAPL